MSTVQGTAILGAEKLETAMHLVFGVSDGPLEEAIGMIQAAVDQLGTSDEGEALVVRISSVQGEARDLSGVINAIEDDVRTWANTLTT